MKFQAYFNRRILVTLLLGFSSGLPLALSGATLSTWYATTAVSTKNIGYLSLIGFPYLFKFLWAPLLDRYTLLGINRRKLWMLASQIGIVGTLIAMALQDPHTQAITLGFLACLLAFLSATQDIAIDAYRTEILNDDEKALGAAMGVNGYRIAMLVSGGLALVYAHHYGWRATYLGMSALMLIGVLAALIGPNAPSTRKPGSILAAIVDALKEFGSRPYAIWLITFFATYKLGDAFAGSLLQPFLLRFVKMSLQEIGSIVKFVGFGATLIGTLLGGFYTPRLGYYRALLLFGTLHALSYLCYMSLYWLGPEPLAVAIVIFFENLANGLVIASFVGFIMSLCNKQFTAFQYALLSALSSMARITMGPLAGHVAEQLGWPIFFIFSVTLALPGLAILVWLKDRISVSRDSIHG